MKYAMLTCAVALVMPAAVVAQATSPSTYVMKAGASDLFERESSNTVKTSTNAGVRNFANMMIRDHTKSTADVKAAAAQAHVAVAPPKLNAEQASNLAMLKKANGAARDRLYISQQKTAHQQALALHQSYAQNGTAAPLKAAAAKIAPVVQEHIQMLNGM